MKILILNGSPKGEHADTMHITRAFVRGMNSETAAETTVKNTVKTIHVIDSHIEYCKGCLNCMRNGGHCGINDDMHGILDELLSSDVVIFSFPLHCYGIPAPLAALVSRTLPLSSLAVQKEGGRWRHVGRADVSGLRCVMICGCGFPGSGNFFNPVCEQFKLLFPGRNTIITVPQSPMFSSDAALPVTEPRLKLVEEAGRQFAESGKIDSALLASVCSPMIPEEVYASIVNADAAEQP